LLSSILQSIQSSFIFSAKLKVFSNSFVASLNSILVSSLHRLLKLLLDFDQFPLNHHIKYWGPFSFNFIRNSPAVINAAWPSNTLLGQLNQAEQFRQLSLNKLLCQVRTRMFITIYRTPYFRVAFADQDTYKIESLFW
jgi:hypothetical protein